MAFDVFISYSRKDLAAATDLAEWLQTAGVAVWIDRHGIGGAESWAGEITAAIRECRMLALLISEHSVSSPNVIKEVALAAKSRKPILPIVLREAELPDSLEYHLAGIHQLPYDDFPSVLAALSEGAQIEQVLPTQPSVAQAVRDKRKSILVVPFEDLSPGHENSWFADGLTCEMISTLSRIQALRVIDRITSMGLKFSHRPLRELAGGLSASYFLAGAVRKFESQIKIDLDLTDCRTGEVLWHTTQKGILADIFEFQENIAKQVAGELEITLSKEEQHRLGDYGTANIEAYELYLRALDCFFEWSREGMKQLLAIATTIVSIDPNFARAYRLEAYALLQLYRVWERNMQYLERASNLFDRVIRLRADLISPYDKIQLFLLQKRFKEAGEVAHQAVKDDPSEFLNRFYLAFFYFNTGQLERAVPEYEMALHLNQEYTDHPDYRMTYWNLTEALDWLGRTEDRERYAFLALPHFERWLAHNPGNQFARVQLATLQLYVGQQKTAIQSLSLLLSEENVDVLALYSMAVFFMHLGEEITALDMLERAVAAGFSHLELIERDPNFNPVRETPRFHAAIESIRQSIERVNAAATATAEAVG